MVRYLFYTIGDLTYQSPLVYKMVRHFFIIKPTRCTNFTNFFWHETLHVSDRGNVRNI